MNLSISVLIALGLCGSPDCSESLPSFTLQTKQDVKKDKEKKRKPGFTISKETTYVTGPLDKDGYIDYETALNERLREGATPENNANVLLFKAFGPHPDGSKIPDEFFKWMKIAAPPEKGDYFVSAGQHVSERFKGDDLGEQRKRVDEVYDVLDKVTKRPWSAKGHPEIAEWLKRNEKPLALVIEASKRPRYYYPLVAGRVDGKSSSLIAALIPGVQKSREFATALTARAMLRVGEKKYDDAWQDLLACHRLGRLLGNGGTLIESLVSISIDIHASDADLAFIESAKLDSKQIKKCIADLQKLPPPTSLADKVGGAERFIFLQAVLLIDRDGPEILEGLSGGKGPAKLGAQNAVAGSVNWDPALRNGNQFYSRMAMAMRLKDRTLREKHLQEIDRDIVTLQKNSTGIASVAKSFLAAKNPPEAVGKLIGDILLRLLFPAVTRVQQAADRAEQTQYNLRVAFALAAYQRDNGKFPKTSDALAPKYLATIPQDLFSGKSLIYRPSADGYLLYSVGVNGRDDDGRSYDDDPPGDDLPVRMPLPKLRERN
jgi:hypothetical protein